ncbi:ionotropic receptor 75a-like [Anopheles darlingi]|uniref:ionotropic receptor 75a-like n=1 Tax=Anopheles darlingi TaxID=43151 RepID=UPI0021004D6E|nr:ionotropic receptor 75a-like [Anopheles darlingi]
MINLTTGTGPVMSIALILLTIVGQVILTSGGQYETNRKLMVGAIGAALQQIDNPLKVTFLTDCWTQEQRRHVYTTIGLLAGQYLYRFTSSRNATIEALFAVLDEDIESHQTLIVLDLSCNASERLLLEAGARLYTKLRWLLVDSRLAETPNWEQWQVSSYLEVLNHCPVLVSSEVFAIIYESDHAVRVVQVYRVSPDSELLLEDYLRWRSDVDGVRMVREDLRIEQVTAVRRQNLHGHTLRASMVITNPETIHHLSDYRYVNKHIDTITKVNYILTNYLAAYLGASVNYSRVATWGYYNSTTGLWDGMIGELVHGAADLGSSPLFFTTDRIAVIEYLAMTSQTRSKFIFRSPKLSYTDNVFVLPFDTKVWACIIAVIVGSSLLLLLTLWAEWHVTGSEAANPPTNADAATLSPNLRDIFLMMYGASCQQGSSMLPLSCSARAITMLIFTVLMFLYASYSANIVALLQSPSTKIRSLEDLLASRLKFGVHDTVFNRYYFTHATEPTRKALYEQKIHGGGTGGDAFLDLDQGIERIRHGLYAFHVEQGVGYKVISETYQEDEKCGLQEIQYLQVIDPYYAIQKNSSFKEHIKIGLFRLNEHGIQYRENAKLYTKKPKCSGGGGKFVPVSMVDVEPAVWIILWGTGLAMAFFLTECLYLHVKQKWAGFVK